MKAGSILWWSASAWASPLHMVPKKDGTWRPCGDYRQLNAATGTDQYPVPNISDMSAKLAGCTVFRKLDLRKGYYQIPVVE
jgi:Reverse transcriptase (RNA-dependent DNA polymerase)